MLTPQEIQETKFSKAVFGGYDMEQVDQLVEPMIRDYTTLYKENSVLKSKLKVLVQKLEELRDKNVGSETATREAQEKCDAMLQETKRKCDEMLRDAGRSVSEEQIAEEKERLECAKKAALNFIDVVEHDIRGHLDLLESLKSRDLAAEKKPPAPPSKPFDYEREANREREIASEIDANLTRQGVMEKEDAASRAPVREEDERPTIKFSNLQFGENYDPIGK